MGWGEVADRQRGMSTSTCTLSTASCGEAQCSHVPSNSHLLFILQTANTRLLTALLPHLSLFWALRDHLLGWSEAGSPLPCSPPAPPQGRFPGVSWPSSAMCHAWMPQVPGAVPALGPQPEVHTCPWSVDRAGKVGRGRYHRHEENGVSWEAHGIQSLDKG